MSDYQDENSAEASRLAAQHALRAQRKAFYEYSNRMVELGVIEREKVDIDSLDRKISREEYKKNKHKYIPVFD